MAFFYLLLALLNSLLVNCEIDLTKPEIINAFLDMVENTYSEDSLPHTLYNAKSTSGMSAKAFSYENMVVLAFKGTTLSLGAIELGESANQDKLVDCTLFSCCKDRMCLREKIGTIKNLFYIDDAELLLSQVRQLYPDKQIILAGHSLGGAIASIVATNNNLQALAVSSPGERYIYNLIGNGRFNSKTVHIGLCKDPIYMGECNHNLSLCKILKYQLDTKCHLGKSFCINTKGPLFLNNHRLCTIKSHTEKEFTIKPINESECTDCNYTQKNVVEHIIDVVLGY